MNCKTDIYNDNSACYSATNFPKDTSTAGSYQGTDEGNSLKATNCYTTGGQYNCYTSGFNALLAGRRSSDGSFYDRGSFAYIWSSLENGIFAWARHLDSDDDAVRRSYYGKAVGFSVRCVKD